MTPSGVLHSQARFYVAAAQLPTDIVTLLAEPGGRVEFGRVTIEP